MDSNDIRLDENDEIAREILQQTQYWTVNNEYPGIVDNDNAYLRTLTQNSSLKLLQESKSTQKALPKGMNKRSKFVGDISLLKLT